MTAPLLATDLRWRITIRRSIETADGAGGKIEAWTTIARPWAEVQGFTGKRGDEQVIGEALIGLFYYRIRLRHTDAVRLADQVVHRGQDLNVTAAFDPDGRREQLWLIATTASAQVTA